MKPNGKPQSFYLARALAITIDLLIFIFAVATLVYIEFHMENVSRGFFCGDTTISFKYKADTIPIKAIIIYALMPIIVLWMVEFIFHLNKEDQNLSSSVAKKCCQAWKTAIKWFCDYAVNLALMLLVMDFSKVFISTHRPHFLNTCLPDGAVNCTAGEFVTDFKCMNDRVSDYRLRDSSRSFPSAHATITTYATVFLIWYLQSRVPKIQSLFLIPFIQSILMIWNCFCCLSRITDHRHHWYDVVGGALLGVFFALYTCYILSNKFLIRKNHQIENVTQLTSALSGSTSATNNNNRCTEQRLLPTTVMVVKEEFTLNNLE